MPGASSRPQAGAFTRVDGSFGSFGQGGGGVDLRAGDVFVVAGRGWLSGAIRFFTRKAGEAPTRASHVGLVVEDGTDPFVIEALGRGVTLRRFSEGPGRGRHAVYRAGWTPGQIALVVARATEDVGKPYGYVGIVTSALDWFLNGAYVFRRLTDKGRTGQFCSWSLWDWCEPPFRDAGLRPFDAPRGCSPDDVDDYVRRRWACVREMS